METKENRRGISLIVLILTILVMIILATAIILAISNSNIITKSNQAVFRSNVKTYLEEYNLWLIEEQSKDIGTFDEKNINVSSKTSYNGKYIQDIIVSIKDKDKEKFEIINGKLTYTGYGVDDIEVLENEINWSEDLGIASVKKALGNDDTIVFVETASESRYDNIKIYGSNENGIEGLSEITLTVTQNLIDNGFGEYKDTTNFSSKISNLPNEKVKGGISCFYATSIGYKNDEAVKKIPIDVGKAYKISMYIKGENSDQKYYSGIIEYDVDNLVITAQHSGWRANTLTYLTEDLNDGDTEVHLNDVSNFVDHKYSTGFIFWNYVDSLGHLYEPLTYSRNVYGGMYTYDNIDKTNNIVTLTNAWSNGTIKAGTRLSQNLSGATFNYSLGGYNSLNGEWEYKEATIKDSVTNGNSNTNSKFRCGVKYVSWFIEPNVTYLSGVGAKFANVIFAESDKYNKEYSIDMTGHEPLRAMEDGTSDYIDYKSKRIIRKVGVNGNNMYKLENETYEEISLPNIPIYEGNTAITINQTGRLEGLYI